MQLEVNGVDFKADVERHERTAKYVDIEYMLGWLRIRFKAFVRYFMVLRLLVFRPFAFAETQIVLEDKKNFYRALNFLATGLTITVGFEVFISWIFETEFNKVLATIFWFLQFLLLGILAWLSHILLDKKKKNLQATYHCYAYVLGALFPISVIISGTVVATLLLVHGPSSEHCDPVTLACLAVKSIPAKQLNLLLYITIFVNWGLGFWGAVLIANFVQTVQGINWAVTMFGPSLIVIPILALIVAILAT